MLSIACPLTLLCFSSLSEDVEKGMEAALGQYLQNNSLGFWFGLRNATESFSFGLGVSDGSSKQASATDVVPAGSLAKPFTAVGVLQLVEKGVVGLDDPIPPHVDSFLQRTNGTTLEKLFGPTINNVTIRNLLHMRSGIQDYSNALITKLTEQDPDWDISPYDYLAMNDKSFKFPPGSQSQYSSINYLLLGLIWAQHTKSSSWDTLDQMTCLPEPERYRGLTFYEHGLCSSYKNTTHFFAHNGTNKSTGDPLFIDMFNTSCLNGPFFGNVGSSAGAAATFFYDLLGAESRILSGATVLEMQQFDEQFTESIEGGIRHYGLGVWRARNFGLMPKSGGGVNTSIPGIYPYLSVVGHAGDDYGTITRSGYHPTLGFGFSMMLNRRVALDGGNVRGIFCDAWRVLWSALGSPVANAEDVFSCDYTW